MLERRRDAWGAVFSGFRTIESTYMISVPLIM